MIKVCYVLSTSEKTGGANKSLLEFLGNLDRKAVEPHVLLRRRGEIEDELNKLNISFIVIPFINSVTTGNRLKDVIKKRTAFLTERKVEKYFVSEGFDLIHNNSLPALAGMEAAYRCRIPYICHLRENVEVGLGIQFLDKEKHLQIAANANAVIAISEYIKKGYSAFIPNIQVMYDGLDTSQYLDQKEILVNDDVTVSIYGNLDKQKGQHIAVQALEMLRDKGIQNIRLRIIGNLNTEYGKALQQDVQSKGVSNVEFISTIQDLKELKRIRKQDDINLTCSSAEGMGRTTIESMLSGSLTIGADAGATTELITDRETGLLFKTGSAESLAEAICYVISNKAKAREMTRKGQETATQRFSIDKYSSRITEIYQNIQKQE